MTKSVTLPDEAELEALRTLARELHEATKDARALLKEVDGARAEMTKVLTEHFDREVRAVVEAGLDVYRQEVDAAMENATKGVYARFDTLRDLLLMGRKVRARRDLSLEELAILQTAVEILQR